MASFAGWRGKDVLEAGCGIATDGKQFALAGARYTGVDFSSTALRLARERFARDGLAGEFVEGSISDLPFPDGSFDLVYSMGVIHHIPETERVVSEFHRVLRARRPRDRDGLPPRLVQLLLLDHAPSACVHRAAARSRRRGSRASAHAGAPRGARSVTDACSRSTASPICATGSCSSATTPTARETRCRRCTRAGRRAGCLVSSAASRTAVPVPAPAQLPRRRPPRPDRAR